MFGDGFLIWSFSIWLRYALEPCFLVPSSTCRSFSPRSVTDRGLKLRQVEEGTKKQGSNAYLSQIENDQIKKPSPNILHALAEFYAISFEKLMDMAGYFPATTSRSEHQRH